MSIVNGHELRMYKTVHYCTFNVSVKFTRKKKKKKSIKRLKTNSFPTKKKKKTS